MISNLNDSQAGHIDLLLNQMTIEQKVGQMMVFGFCGPIITPDIVELIQRYHVGGLRISQKFRSLTLVHDLKPGTEADASLMRSIHYPSGNYRDFSSFSAATRVTAAQYATVLNRLRTISRDRPLSIPIHFTVDQEGSACDDILSGQRLFPHPKGLAASGEPALAYRAALQTGRQLKALGVNMTHSPVLDVNTNPMNPEIGSRSFSEDPDEVIVYAREAIRGYLDAGLICTGKHFPGRGESISDAHWDLPLVDLSLERLTEDHLRPYRELIGTGLPAIMTAHSQYPALGVEGIPASTSRRVITDLLRGELGFEGLVTTDNMMMGGILKHYEMVDAVKAVIKAGHDLVLCRDETPLRLRILEGVAESVRNGEIEESQIDASVRRILAMRFRQGLFETQTEVDSLAAEAIINDPDVVEVALESARKSTLLLRDRKGLLPVASGRKTLLIEQVFPTQQFANNFYSHPGLLWEALCRRSEQVGCVEIGFVPTENDLDRVERRLDEADLVIMTNYYYHKAASSNTEMVRKILAKGKQVVVVTNSPYVYGAPDDFETVIVCYQPGGPEYMDAVAELIYETAETTSSARISKEYVRAV